MYQTQETYLEKATDDSLMRAEIANQSRVSGFKEKLALLRTQRFAALQEKRAAYDALVVTVQSREDLLNLFKSEAKQMYPEIETTTLKESLDKVTETHPLKQLWGKYKLKLGPMMSELVKLLHKFKVEARDAVVLYEAELDVLTEYQTFAGTADTPVPTVDEMVTDLIAVEDIPQAEESSLIASVPSLELLDADVADGIALEALALEESYAQIEANKSMAVLDASASNGNMKPIGLILGGLALAYFIFGS